MAVTPPEAAVSPAADPALLCNRPFAQIAVGDVAAMERTLSLDDIQLLALLYGDLRPQQLGPAAGSSDFHGVIGHGMWAAALISSLLGTRLPGPGTIYLAQTLHFRIPLQIGDTLQMRVQVRARDEVSRCITLACIGTNQHGAVVIEGEADVIAPDKPIERPRASLPTLRLLDGGEQSLCERAQQLGRIRVAVVHPCDATSLAAALDAHTAGLIEPLLVAPRTKLEDVAREAGLDLSGLAIEDVEHSHAAAARAAALAASGQVEALMKGSLHTDELMAAVVRAEAGLRTARRISHCYLMHTPAYPRPFIITDAAINIAPTLEDKADIVRNAVALAHLVGVAMPRVAILAAVETVNPHMPATLDAAVLCKMAERGQITGAVLDGPLAFDNAISAAAARIKGIVSPVAGRADILVVPDLESGNMLAKQLEYLGGAASAGIVMGARVPIVLTSRADSRESRVASCALASLVAHHYRTNPP